MRHPTAAPDALAASTCASPKFRRLGFQAISGLLRNPISIRFPRRSPCENCSMLRMLSLLFGLLVHSLRSREALLLENLALRQQLAVLQLPRPKPRLSGLHHRYDLAA